MSSTILKAARLASVTFAVVGATLILGQVAAGFIVVQVLGSVVHQMLG